MGKTKKSRTAGAVEAAMSRPSELDIVRAECEKAVKSMKNNPPKAQKLIRENCEKHPRVSLGFRYHAYIEKRLAEQQPNVSALKKRHVNVALQAAKRATVLSPNSVEHAFFYANLLQEYMPRPVDKEHDVEAIAECKRALAIAEPDDPAEDMLGELPEELKTAEMRVGHFKHQLRQLSHQMKLAGLQHVFKHVSVDANGNFVPLVANQGLRSGQLTSDLWNKKGTEKTSEVGVEQTSQTEGRDEGQEEQRGEDGGESSGDGIGASQNDGTEETLSELNSRGESAGAEEGEEPGQVPSGESAEPLTEVENGEASSQQEKVGEPCEEDEEEESIKRKQSDWHLLRMVNREDLGTVWSFLEEEALHTAENEGAPQRTTDNLGEPASSEPPDPHPAAPAGDSEATGVVERSIPPAEEVVSEGNGGVTDEEPLGLEYLKHSFGSDGTVGVEALQQRNFVGEAVEDPMSWAVPFGVVQGRFRGKVSELMKHVMDYVSGTGVADLRGCPVQFRRMTSQQVGDVLDAFCSERAWWLFTWDLLRSPREHFDVMRAWLESPENDVIGETIRGMALAALRARAHTLRHHYGAMKLRLLADGEGSAGPAARRELARLALAAAAANQEFASCIHYEATEFCGRKYVDALRFVYGKFTDEPTAKTVVMNARWLDDVLPAKAERLSKAPAGHREWRQRHYDILEGLKPGLQSAIEELKFANVVNDNGEAAVDSRTERRLKVWEGEARWVAESYFNAPVIVTWLRRKLGDAGGNFLYSEEYLKRALFNAIAGKDSQTLRLQLGVALGEKRAALADELWALLGSALLSADGIPCQLTEAADQAAAELLRAESEPSAKAVKKRKKKKGEPKDKPARLPAANPCSQEAESSAESTSESSPGQEAVSEGNAEQKGDGKGVANLAGSARCEGGDGVVRREPEGGVTAEGNDSTKGTAIEEPELQEEETGPSPADRLRRQVEAESGAGVTEQGATDPPTVAPAGEPEANDAAGGATPPALEVFSEGMEGIRNGEAFGLEYLKHEDGSEGTVGIEALGQRDFVEEAVEDPLSWALPFGGKEMIQRAISGKGSDLMKHLMSYAVGTGVADLRACPVQFRMMTSQQAGEVLKTYCSERAWWLFTWDLLRSPAEHFVVIRAWLESPENDVIRETVRSMALAALRARANLLGNKYRGAKARLLAGGEASATWQARRELARLALAVLVAAQEFADCICRETRDFSGRKYADVLRFVHADFAQEPTPEMASMDATWIDDVRSGEAARIAGVPEGQRKWLELNFYHLACLKVGLQRAIEEFRFANVVIENNENAVDSGAERRWKGWEGEPRWAVDSAVNVPVILTWLRRKLGEDGGNFFYSEKYLERILPAALDVDVLRLQLKVALGHKRIGLANELFVMLASALMSPDGIPDQLKEAAEQAAAELLKAESEPTQKAVKKRKKKKNAEPKDEPAKLPAASPSSPQVKPSAGTASESQTKQDAVSEANAPLKGDGKGVAVSEGSAQYRGGDGGPDSVLRLREEVLPTAEPKGGVARGELERGGTAESTASAEGTAVVASDAEEEETSSVLVCPLRRKVEAQSEAGQGEQVSIDGPMEPSDATGAAKSATAEAAPEAKGSGAVGQPGMESPGRALDRAKFPPGTTESASHTELTSATEAADAVTLPADKGAQGLAQIDGTEQRNDGTEQRNDGAAGSESGAMDGVEALRQRDFVREAVDDVEGCIFSALDSGCTTNDADQEVEFEKRFLEYLAGSGVAELPGRSDGFFRTVERAETLHEYLLSACSDLAWWEFTLDLLRSPREHFLRSDLWQWLGKREHDNVGETIRSMAVAALKMREHALRVRYQAVEERLKRPMGAIDGCDGGEKLRRELERPMGVIDGCDDPPAGREKLRSELERPMGAIDGCDDREKLRSELERLAIGVTLTQAEFAKCLYCEALFFQGRKFVHGLSRVYACFAEAPGSKSLRDNLASIERVMTSVELALLHRERTEAAAPEGHRAWVKQVLDVLEEQKPGLEASLRELERRLAAAQAEDGPEKAAAKSRGLLTSSLNVPVIMTWMERRIAAAGLNGGSVKRVEAILLDTREWQPTELDLALRSALGDKGAAVATELWILLDSARDEPDGIPWQIKEAAEAAAADLLTDEGRAKELVGALETALHKLVKAATKAAGAVTLSTGAEGARGSTDNHGTERRNDGTERWKGGTERQNDGTEWRKDGAERRIDGTERRNDGATGSGAQAESGADEAVALPRRAFVQNFMGHVVDELSSALGRDILEGLSPDVVESFVGPNGRKAAANAGGEPEKKAAGSWGVLTSFANVPVIMTWVRRRFAEAGLSSGAVKRVEAILWDAREWGPTELLLALRTALGERETALALCKDLWMMLHSARDEPDGIPRQIKEAAEAAAAELLSAETATDVKGTRKGKKKKKKGQSTDERETSPAAAGGESAEKVAVSGDDVSQPAPVTSASSKPGDEPGDNGEVKPGDDKPGAQMTGESEAASRLGAEVEKPGGSNQSSGERRPGGSEQRSGNAGNPGPSDRSGVGAGAGRGAAEAADVTGGQHEVRVGPASAGTKKGSGVVAPPISTPSVERPSLRPAYAPPVIAPDAPKPVTDGETKPGTPNESKPATPGKTKPRTPGRRQPDAGGRSDAKTLSESHVAAGERLALRGTLGGQLPQTSTVALAPVTESVTAASKPHTQQAAPKPYRPVLPGSGPPTASRGAPVGAHVSHDDLGPLLPTPPLTPPSRGSQRVKNRSPGVQKGQSPTAKRESNRGERPLVVSPGVTTPGVNLSGDKILASPRATNTLQAQANPNPNRNPNPNPSPNPQHSPVSSGPPRKPRAPYNPLARTGPLAPAAPTGQTPVPTGQSASPTGRSAASTGQSASLTANSVPITPTKRRTPAAVYQPPAKSFEPSTVGVADMTSAEASADVTRNALRLLVVGESDANALRGQRSPEPSPLSAELPSILAMLLPVENANKSAAPPGYAPSFDVYKPESDHLISATESPGASHVASNDWVGTTESGIDSWGEPASIESPIASEKAVGRKKTKTRRGADNQDDHGSEVCCICFDNPKNGAIIPCGHCLCYECGTLIKEKRGECPFCNTKIESVFKLFF